MFKKSIGIILTVCMLIGTMIPVCADNGISFKDVPNNSLYKDSIKQMSDSGIIKGFSDDTFGYENLCTRAQFITFLYRAAGSPDAGKPSGFADVNENSYYADAISWAYNNGIAKGFEGNTFGVDMTVDRSHAVSFLYQWAKVTGKGNMEKSCYLSEYVDADDNDMKNMIYNPKEIVVMVYDGSSLLCVSDANGEVSYKILEGDDLDAQLLSALETRYDLFFALRPSQISE